MRVDDILGPPKVDDILGPRRESQDGRGAARTARTESAPTMVPSYDPMGMPTGGMEPAVEPSRMSYPEQMSNVGGFARALGEGVVAGVPGVVGDVESLGRAGINALQRPEVLRRALTLSGPFAPALYGASLIGPVEKETVFPTTTEVARGLFGESEAPGGETLREVGSIFSPLGTVAKGVTKGGRTLLESSLIGRPTVEQARVAAEAEAAGLRVRSRQARESEPGTEALSASEQRAINREANEAAGIKADAFDSAAVDQGIERFDREYRRIYGNVISVDEDAARILQQIIRDERVIDPAGSYQVAETARNFLRRWQEAKRAADEQEMLLQLQRQRVSRSPGQFVERKFGPNERIDAPDLTPDILRELGATDVQNLRPITSADAPQWAPQVNGVINELVETLGLRVRPKVYIGEGTAAYAWASPTGHIFINERLIGNNGRGALATALHEFGHMVEFQLLAHAPKELQTSIRKAYAEQTKASRQAGATIEQLRPVTAEKYDQLSRGRVPQTPGEIQYFHGFQEWFAEQVSRWMTQTKEPVTMVDKFFAKIADFWKAIYQRVTGYTGMVTPIDEFMRSNWNGKLISDNLVQRIYQAPEVRGGVVTQAQRAREPVIAYMPGEQVRRLRSALSEFAARTQDGNQAFAARELVKRIDAMIERTNPRIAKDLKKINQQYRAFMDLRELRRANAGDIAVSGNVSPQAVGRLLTQAEAGPNHPLARIGRYGQQLGFRSRTEGAESKKDILNYLLTRPQRWLRTGLAPLSGPLATGTRSIQRRMIPGAPPPPSSVRPTTEPARAAAAGGRAVYEPEE